MELLATIIN